MHYCSVYDGSLKSEEAETPLSRALLSPLIFFARSIDAEIFDTSRTLLPWDMSHRYIDVYHAFAIYYIILNNLLISIFFNNLSSMAAEYLSLMSSPVPHPNFGESEYISSQLPFVAESPTVSTFMLSSVLDPSTTACQLFLRKFVPMNSYKITWNECQCTE